MALRRSAWWISIATVIPARARVPEILRPIVVVFAGTHQTVMVCVGILEVLRNVSLYVYADDAGH
jgi:hypothetical protein